MVKVKYTKKNPEKTKINEMNISCTKCDWTFKDLQNLKRHFELLQNPTVTRYYCNIGKKSYCRKNVVKRHIKNHPQTEFDESLIFTWYNPREIAEKPQVWNPPFESRPKSDKKQIFRIISAEKPYIHKPSRSTSNETICFDELRLEFQNRTLTVYGIYGLFY